MQLNIPISGELPGGVVNRFLEHPEASTDAGVAVYNGFLEDDILARAFFNIDAGKRLSQIIMGFEVENTVTGETYELERFAAALQQYITNTFGIQEIEFNAERGYKLEANNNKNWVKVVRNPGGDTVATGAYQLLFAQKIRWEYWLQRQNVPVEFYNNELAFNGSNNNWLDYLRATGQHRINFFILFDVAFNGEVKRYKNAFMIDFKGYDENENIETEHNYYNDETNESLNIGTDPQTGRPLGMLLSNVNTRIEILYRKLNGDWDLSNVYSVTTLEINEGVGAPQFRQLSSIWGSEYDNILIPLAGQQRILVQLIEPDLIKTTCVVDYTKLSPAAGYKITGRIGCYANDNGVPISKRVYDENKYSTNYE